MKTTHNYRGIEFTVESLHGQGAKATTINGMTKVYATSTKSLVKTMMKKFIAKSLNS